MLYAISFAVAMLILWAVVKVFGIKPDDDE